mmetsp:Transcript_11099/g.20598  ORF Transcript_11099/g.20598 Transcript_11099/m.20598 type:complete len:101 (+) Transcript_11099:152-454(+)
MRLYLVLLLAPLASAKLGQIDCDAESLEECMEQPYCTWFEGPLPELHGCRDWSWDWWCTNTANHEDCEDFRITYLKNGSQVTKSCGSPTTWIPHCRTPAF